MRNNELDIMSYWTKKARASDDFTITGNDSNLRELEIIAISTELAANSTVLDFGCGTGKATYEYSKIVKMIYGIDLCHEMVEIANKRYRSDNLMFLVDDVRSFYTAADIVMSTRCLINLVTNEDQLRAIDNMVRCVKKGGKLLLMETYKEPFDNCDALRKALGIGVLKRHWHNLHLSLHDTLSYLADRFETCHSIGFNLYYFISRIIYPLLSENQAVNHPLNKIGLEMSKIINDDIFNIDFSPIKLIVCNNKI